MAGFSNGESGLDGLQVPHLPHENDVRVLPKDMFEGFGKAFRVRVDLPLIDDALVVGVQVLDRVLNGYDMGISLIVDPLNH